MTDKLPTINPAVVTSPGQPMEGQMLSTNVIDFPSVAPPRRALVLINPDAELRDGELVAFQFGNRDGTYGRGVVFGRWYGPRGRGYRGRFVRKGSPEECHYIDGMAYRPSSDFVKVLGRVACAEVLP